MKQTSERLGVKIVGGLKEVNTPWAGSSLLGVCLSNGRIAIS
jgi:hypothetical protein